MTELERLKKEIERLKHPHVRLEEEGGLGVQYINPERLEQNDDGSYTVVVKAWRKPLAQLSTRG